MYTQSNVCSNIHIMYDDDDDNFWWWFLLTSGSHSRTHIWDNDVMLLMILLIPHLKKNSKK